MKLFGIHVREIKDELCFEEFLLVLDALDYANGEIIFEEFVRKHFVDSHFNFNDDLDEVLTLARIFSK